MSDGILDGDRIRAHLAEVAAALPAGRPPHRLILVGGSLLAWHGLRDSTRDVDSVVALGATLRQAVKTVAARHGLAPGWLNDHARPFAPQTLREQDCDLLADLPALRVLGRTARPGLPHEAPRDTGAHLGCGGHGRALAQNRLRLRGAGR